MGRIRHREVEIEAATGPLLVGEDEEQDEQKLRAWQPIFVKMFGAAALPAELHDAPVKKQLAAHLAAREALPGTTDGQVYRAAQRVSATGSGCTICSTPSSAQARTPSRPRRCSATPPAERRYFLRKRGAGYVF